MSLSFSSSRRCGLAWWVYCLIMKGVMVVANLRLVAVLTGFVFVLVACGDNAGGDPATSSTSVPSSSTSSIASPSTTLPSSTVPAVGLDLSDAVWVTHGPDGIHKDDGTLVWETATFPAQVARDHEGGLVFVDSGGLWWFPIHASEPTRVWVAAPIYELVDVAFGPDGPIAVLWDYGPEYVRLADGEFVDAPGGMNPVPDNPWEWHWTAANGLSAWVTEPEVEWDSEGQPSQVLEPAHLIIAEGDLQLVDIRVGGFYEPWARIHDFDGQTIIVSRGPFEPAMPEETFLLIDLAEGAVTKSFVAGGTSATLTGIDMEWTGPVEKLDLGGYTESQIITDEGVTTLESGRYLVYVQGSPDGVGLEVDLAVWFSGNEANMAARIDGETDIPVSNGYYIRNADPTALTLPVAEDVSVTSVWYDYDTDPDLENDPITYQQFVDVIQGDEESVQGHLRNSPWWATVQNGTIVALDEQYVP